MMHRRLSAYATVTARVTLLALIGLTWDSTPTAAQSTVNPTVRATAIAIATENAGAPPFTTTTTTTTTTFVQQQTLTEPVIVDIDHDRFGDPVALSADGNTLATGAVGTEGYGGTVYVFTRRGGSYVIAATLTEPRAGRNHFFGAAVALSADGTVLAVSAVSSFDRYGRAYIFVRNGDRYILATTFTDPANTFEDYFGTAMALSGNGKTFAVNARGTNMGQGAVYLYTRNEGESESGYTLATTLTDSGGMAGDSFGKAIALSTDGGTLAAMSAARMVGGRGKVSVFVGSGSIYALATTFADPAATDTDRFGGVVALNADGGILAVGTSSRNDHQGIVHVYTRSEGGYLLVATLPDPVYTDDDGFGGAVSLSADGRTLAVGAHGTLNHNRAQHMYTSVGQAPIPLLPISMILPTRIVTISAVPSR